MNKDLAFDIGVAQGRGTLLELALLGWPPLTPSETGKEKKLPRNSKQPLIFDILVK